MALIPFQLNGVLTQGENIADNGGLHESFRAYVNSVEQQVPIYIHIDKVSSETYRQLCTYLILFR
jgi:predicted metalloendopeptidase